MISFIIPAYNAESYLPRVVDVFYSTPIDADLFEVIIVENGSTDATTEIAKALSQKYSNVRLLHSDKGVSNARNLGIREAKGEWIAFVDADDYLTKDGLSIMLHDINENQYDFVLYGHEAGEKKNFVSDKEKGEIFSNVQDARVQMLENPTRYMQVWAKLFKKELILQNDIFFDQDLRLSEDSDFTLQYSKVCSNIYFSSQIVYHYSIDNVSTMRMYGDDKLKQYVFAMNRTKKRIQDESNRIKKAFDKYILMHLNIALVRDVFCVANKQSYLKKIACMKTVIKESVFKEAIMQTGLTECKSFRMLPIFCMKLHLYWFAGLIYCVRAISNHAKEK